MVKMPFQCSSMSQPLWVCTSKKMDENTSLHFFLLNNIIKNNRKRRQELDDDVDWYLQNKRKRKNDGSDDILIMTTVQTALMMHSKPQHKPRMPNVDRDGSKIWWSNGYANWSEEEFKHRLRISRENFEFILRTVGPYIEKTPTNLVSNPIESHRELALTLYRLAHGCSFPTLSDLFGTSRSLSVETFNKMVRELQLRLYSRFVKAPDTDAEWEAELRGFLENYGFPCVGAWDGFHVYISSNLKNHFSFKKRYSVSNMAVVSYNKCFMDLTVNAPGSTHDARLLKFSKFYEKTLQGIGLPNKTVSLGEDLGEIPLVTIGDSAFPRHAWLVKGFNENTVDPRERYFNKKLCSARVVSENCYGMCNIVQENRIEETQLKVYYHDLCYASQLVQINKRPV